MSEREEREIQKVRLRLLDIVKSFFGGQPDAVKLSRWRGTFSALTRERVNPVFDQSVRDIHSCLENRTLVELQDEYYDLFTDPFTTKQLSTTASYYLDGRSYGQTLVELRGLFSELGVEKRKEVIETEDSLVVILDVLARLIDESDSLDKEKSQKLQSELLKKYLLPLSQNLNRACGENKSARFYKACSDFFCGYLELEKGLIGLDVTH